MNILDCIGKSPLIHLERISRVLGVGIYAKLESANPSLSIKDRVAMAYVQGAMQRGELDTGGCVVEASTGNLGLALAQVCLKLDLRLLLCMPASVGKDRIALLYAMGAHVFVTPAEEGMQGALAKAAYHHEDTWGSFRPNPMGNPDGPACYAAGLGEEIAAAAKAQSLVLDAFMCSVGTGATFTGVGRCLRQSMPHIFLGAVTSPACPSLAPLEGQVQDVGGANFADGAPSIMDNNLISQKFNVSIQDAAKACHKLLGMEGIRAGLSSGANLHAVLQLALQAEWRGKNIVIVMHDMGKI